MAKTLYTRNIGTLLDTIPDKIEEGLILDVDGNILEGGTVKNIQYVNGEKSIDVDGNVESTTKEVNLKELVEAGSNSPFTIDPDAGYTSMKQVKVTAALKDMDNIDITSESSLTIGLGSSAPEYGMHSVTVTPKLLESYSVSSPLELTSKDAITLTTANRPSGVTGNYCGLKSITVKPELATTSIISAIADSSFEATGCCGFASPLVVKYGKITVDDLDTPVTATPDECLNALSLANGHYPIFATKDGVNMYGNLDVEISGSIVTQTIIYATETKHNKLVRTGTIAASVVTWGNFTITSKSLA